MLSKMQAVLICLFFFKRLRHKYPELWDLGLSEAKKIAEEEVEHYLNVREG